MLALLFIIQTLPVENCLRVMSKSWNGNYVDTTIYLKALVLSINVKTAKECMECFSRCQYVIYRAQCIANNL